MTSTSDQIALLAADGHRWTLLHRIPGTPRASLLWLPALGVAARHYLAFAEALQHQGVAVFLHDSRGHGSSSWRASRHVDWGYKELLELDLPVSMQAMHEAVTAPRYLIGGHSLGGQLACCLAALAPHQQDALWLVGSGTPHWRSFPCSRKLLLPPTYRFLRWLAQRNGALPGRRIGFGGNEARGLIDDWTLVGLSGRYAGRGLNEDLESALSNVSLPVNSVLFTHDWYAPPSSLAGLTQKFAVNPTPPVVMDTHRLGTTADHFAWMKRPHKVVESLISTLA